MTAYVEPAFDWDAAWSYSILGTLVDFAGYDPLTFELLVMWTDGHFTLVPGVPLITSASANQATIIGIVASAGLK